MQTDNYKTPVAGTPFFVIPSAAMFVERHGHASYETEPIDFFAEGVKGRLSISIERGSVFVSLLFGRKRPAELELERLIIDDRDYAVSLRLPAGPFATFDFDAMSRHEPEFEMYATATSPIREVWGNPDIWIDKGSALFTETRARFTRSALANLRLFSAEFPSFGGDLREAVASAEIARLRLFQQEAWDSMVRRADKIREYMKFVPHEAAKLPPEPAWTLASEEGEREKIGFEVGPSQMKGVGVAKIEIHQSVLGSLVLVDLLDGTSETHSIT